MDGSDFFIFPSGKSGSDLLSQRRKRSDSPEQAGTGGFCLDLRKSPGKTAKKAVFHHPIGPGGFCRLGRSAHTGRKGEKHGTGSPVFPGTGSAGSEKGRHPGLYPSNGGNHRRSSIYPAAVSASQRRPASPWNRLGERLPLSGIHFGILHRRRSIPTELVSSTVLQMEETT